MTTTFTTPTFARVGAVGEPPLLVVCLMPAARKLLRPGEPLVLSLRDKAIPKDTSNVQGAVGDTSTASLSIL